MNRRCVIAGLAAALLLPYAAAAAPHINFTRSVPALHDLGGEHVAVTYANGDDRARLATFVDAFVEHANRGSLQVDNAIGRRKLRDKPEALLGVTDFTCTTAEHSGEGSTRDSSGERIKRHQVWIDAVCSARIDVLDGNGKKRYSFATRGEGTSPRVETLTDEERDIALEQAARFAAISASETILPLRVRETIVLDDSAPSFDEAMAMIDAGRLNDARAILELALRQHRGSAALHFDIAAVAEAMGDVDAAGEHFRQALEMSPGRREYRSELELFRRRNKR